MNYSSLGYCTEQLVSGHSVTTDVKTLKTLKRKLQIVTFLYTYAPVPSLVGCTGSRDVFKACMIRVLDYRTAAATR